jgi:eukaryotic-like serine/threonine-protein kinase
MAPSRLAPGTMLSGRYQLAEAIGESDLSVVYAATDVRGGAPVAVKLFDRAVMSRAAALSEYQSQARQASGLGAEGIARAYDFGIDANSGVPFSTAERISWASLDRRVLSHGPLGAADLSRALSVLARALDAAHAAHIVHRDLKPQNVFISPDNPEWVRITDFGVSAVRRGAPEAMGWGGPAGYTPPDAVDAAAVATPGVDLFALGVIAFFALTRGTPFRSLRSPGFDPNSHWSELNQPLNPVSERAKEIGVALDPVFDAWFARALALSPHERFRSAGEMARELDVLASQVSLRGGGGPRSMPGIAAAIAQPLVFQPEPSPASLGLGAGTPASPALTAADAAAATTAPPAPTPLSVGEEPVSGLPKRKSSLLPLLIGVGGVLFAGLAYAGYQALGGPGEKAVAEPPSPSPSAAAPTPSAAPATAASAEPTGPAKARFSCQPEACEWVVCDGKNVAGIEGEVEVAPGPHECSASKLGFGSKSLTFAATPGQVVSVLFELPALPAKAAAAPPATAAPAVAPKALADAAKPAAPPAKAAAVAPKPVASAKPSTAAKAAATTQAAKDASASGKPKKKCSTFLGCK